MQYSEDDLHIFDCDGVILNSNNLKIEALCVALEFVGGNSAFIDWAMHEFRTNFGRTRAKHFELFQRYSEIEGFTFTPEMSIAAMTEYSGNVVKLYQGCDVICETSEYMSTLPSDDLIYVISASDESELRSILPVRVPFLKVGSVFGGPTSKAKNIEMVMNNCNKKHVYFYGDAIQDGKAAMSNGVEFLGLTKYSADPKALSLFCELNNQRCYEHCLQVQLL